MTVNIAIMGSTRGTDLQPVINAIESGKLTDVNLSIVISNKKDAAILERAKKHKIESLYIDGEGKTREEYDKAVDHALTKKEIDLVLLIGYMKIMSPDFVHKWFGRVMNIHPSLLPAFAGGMDLNVHEEVLKRGCKVTGCSLIFIDEGADTGPIILQKVCPVTKDDDSETLKKKVQRLEGDALIEGIELFRDGRLSVKGNIVRVSA